MCIACELGYWAMVDALEAERDAAKRGIAAEGPTFTCTPGADEVAPSQAQRAQPAVDEKAP